MRSRSLSDWLAWQESLNPAEIELGLDRVRLVAQQLGFSPPAGAVFVVAGTNGKGSCSAILEAILRTSGSRVGVYSSPHLVRYNERVRVNGEEATDTDLENAFVNIESVRAGVPLTFFEFGTLAALQVFSQQECDAWVLEVGLGGRLDAVNIVDADYSIITTIDIDHQDWLGDTIEKIAAEKAGVVRRDKPAFYGDKPVPKSIRRATDRQGATLYCLDETYSYKVHEDTWEWFGADTKLPHLPIPPGGSEDQIRNVSLALAVAEQYDCALLDDTETLAGLIATTRLPGRFQIYSAKHQWILDVAHNRQAAAALRDKILRLESTAVDSTTIVIGMLADKQVEDFARELAGVANRWVTCSTSGIRGGGAEQLADCINELQLGPAMPAGTIEQGMEMARTLTPEGGRILVCGSFLVVGPALEWLGLY